MCTQEIIWCSCGHGELLPILICPRGRVLGCCYTIVHGNHNVVMPARCSWCKSGLNKKAPLGSPRPVTGGELAEKIESLRDAAATAAKSEQEEESKQMKQTGEQGEKVDTGGGNGGAERVDDEEVFRRLLNCDEYWPNDGRFPSLEDAFAKVEDTLNIDDTMDMDFMDFDLDPDLLK